jgi:Mg-chelatase subunit ChlD
VGAYATNGVREALWQVEPPPGAGIMTPDDIAAGPGGRLYVLDRETFGVLVHEPRTGVPAPTPTPTTAPPCTATGNKTAAPATVALNDLVTVTLSLEITCQGGSGPQADIVLILDRSSSMAGAGCSKLCEAQRAARSFVQGLDLSRHRVGLVSFSDSVTLDLALTGDGTAIATAIDAVRPAGNTNIAGALARASHHLRTQGRAGALPVILMLTDGDPSGTEQAFVDAVREGRRFGQLGGLAYAIGLGANVNAQLLSEVVGDGARYFYAPSPAELKPIYDRLSESIDDIVATDVEIDDDMGPNVIYEAGSATGGPRVSPGNLLWDVGTVPTGGIRLTYAVRPQAAGVQATNAQAVARYSVDGVPQTFQFPVPTVNVIDVATPSPTPTATRSVTPGPARKAYLPIAMQQVCLFRHRRLGADVVLVIDSSSSMAGSKIDAAIAAAQAFVGLVDPQRDRVGAVAFDDDARLVYLITGDFPALQSALATITVGEGTRIDLGVHKALQAFTYRGRPGSQRVIVLLSDGVPTAGTAAAAEDAAAQAKAAGITVFTIGLGPDADADLMSSLASRRSDYYPAPSEGDLAGIYRAIAERIPCR